MSDPDVVGHKILRYEEVASTNDVALRVAVPGTVVVARAQTGGRGRRGRSWHSAAGLGLYFSVALEGQTTGLTPAAALAVRDAVRPACPLSIKWPNDLLHKDRKVCGILVEQRDERAALGIGINVHHRPEDFPPALRDTCTSLAQVSGTTWDENVLLNEVLEQIRTWLHRLQSPDRDSVFAEWRRACGIIGRRVRVDGREQRVVDMESDGALLVEDDSGRRFRVFSGDLETALSRPAAQ